MFKALNIRLIPEFDISQGDGTAGDEGTIADNPADPALLPAPEHLFFVLLDDVLQATIRYL